MLELFSFDGMLFSEFSSPGEAPLLPSLPLLPLDEVDPFCEFSLVDSAGKLSVFT